MTALHAPIGAAGVVLAALIAAGWLASWTIPGDRIVNRKRWSNTGLLATIGTAAAAWALTDPSGPQWLIAAFGGFALAEAVRLELNRYRIRRKRERSAPC